MQLIRISSNKSGLQVATKGAAGFNAVLSVAEGFGVKALIVNWQPTRRLHIQYHYGIRSLRA